MTSWKISHGFKKSAEEAKRVLALMRSVNLTLPRQIHFLKPSVSRTQCQTFELKYIKGRSDFNSFPLLENLPQAVFHSLFLTFKDLNKQHKETVLFRFLSKHPNLWLMTGAVHCKKKERKWNDLSNFFRFILHVLICKVGEIFFSPSFSTCSASGIYLGGREVIEFCIMFVLYWK